MINKSVFNAVLLLNALKDSPGMKLKDFCEQHGLSTPFMEQIGHKMVKAGFLTSKKGPGGGYSLAKENIQLLDVLKIFTTGKKKMIGNDELSQKIMTAISPINVLQ